jgi:hypothetical protein
MGLSQHFDKIPGLNLITETPTAAASMPEANLKLKFELIDETDFAGEESCCSRTFSLMFHLASFDSANRARKYAPNPSCKMRAHLGRVHTGLHEPQKFLVEVVLLKSESFRSDTAGANSGWAKLIGCPPLDQTILTPASLNRSRFGSAEKSDNNA